MNLCFAPVWLNLIDCWSWTMDTSQPDISWWQVHHCHTCNTPHTPKTESSYDGQLQYEKRKEKDIHSFTEGWIALDRICQSHVYCVTCRQTTSKADMSVSFLKALITTENCLWRITIREGSTDSSLLHQIVHFMSYNFFSNCFFVFVDKTWNNTNSQSFADEQERVGAAQRIC